MGGVGIAGVLLIALVVVVPAKLYSETTGKVDASLIVVDLGDIDRSEGSATSSVVIKNKGKGVLELHRLSTSCGCTTAEMSMLDMAPGESREMKISFDPMVHPDQTGEIIRVVYLQTSDPEIPELEIDVIGNVVDDKNI